MIKIDLVTGFLGSGKTTFIIKYVNYLVKQGEKVGIIENDFGAINVDMLLLQDKIGDKCDLEMISGGFDQDSHQRRFKTKLIAMKMLGYDRIIIEPSGIYDVDEFFDVLREEPLDSWYEIDNVIAIVNGKLEADLSKEANFLLASQIANAATILLSRIDECNHKQINRTIDHLNKALTMVQCKRKLDNEIMVKKWHDLTDDDFKTISTNGYVLTDYLKLSFDQHEIFNSLFFMNVHQGKEQLINTVKKIFNDHECGKVFRIKGFINENDTWYELNATKQEITLQPISIGQEIIIVIGEQLQKDNLAKYW